MKQSMYLGLWKSLVHTLTGIATTCKSAWYHLHHINNVRRFLTMEKVKSVIMTLWVNLAASNTAYVTSCCLDQNKNLWIGIPKKLLSWLQLVQNAAARLIMGLKKWNQITPPKRSGTYIYPCGAYISCVLSSCAIYLTEIWTVKHVTAVSNIFIAFWTGTAP